VTDIHKRERAQFIWALAEDGKSHTEIAAIMGMPPEGIPTKITLGARLQDVQPDWDKRIPKPEPVGKRVDNLVVTPLSDGMSASPTISTY
jgi:hypothetical protein